MTDVRLISFAPIIDDMLAAFVRLGEHVREHGAHLDEGRISSEVEDARWLWRNAIDEDGGWHGDDGDWDAFWHYLRNHVAGWWC